MVQLSSPASPTPQQGVDWEGGRAREGREGDSLPEWTVMRRLGRH
jgi:hypothetical protein